MSHRSNFARTAQSVTFALALTVSAGTLAAAEFDAAAAGAALPVQFEPARFAAPALVATTPSYLGFGRLRRTAPMGSLKDGPIAPPSHWNGCYVGLHAGGLFDDSQVRTQFDDVVVTDAGGDGFAGGVHVGCNAQYESGWVVGVELDGSFGDKIDALGSARLRIGYGPGTTLVYGTFGVGVADSDFTVTAPGFSDEVNDTVSGVVAGGGLEFKLSDNLSFGVEGLYYGFSSAKLFDTATGNVEVDEDVAAVRGRLSLHFGGRDGFARSISDF